MQEIIKLLICVIVLSFGIPIGDYLALKTKKELPDGQVWFKGIIITSLILGFVGLIIKDDVLLFTMFFIAIITSRSLRNKNRRNKK
jgi:hypothetical protein